MTGASEPFFSEAADWDLFDANVRVGLSGVHGELALEKPELVAEMERFYIRRALVSHWTAEEYDSAIGNEALARDLDPRFTPAWSALPGEESVAALDALQPTAIRLTPAVAQHNFAIAPWCSGALFEYLQSRGIVTLLSRNDIEWTALATLLENFPRLVLVLLDIGYRADRYLFPLLRRFPLLHFDSATYLAHRQLEAYVDRFGASQVLFGTRLPLYTPAAVLGVLASARISVEDLRAIAGGNLRGLLAEVRTGAGVPA